MPSLISAKKIQGENISTKYGITREEQDAFGARSFLKAERAQAAGHFTSEIVPVTTSFIDPSTGVLSVITVTEDDGIRAGTTQAVLAKLRPAFAVNGSTTAGTSSQVTDGAAAVLLARRSFAQEHNLPILGRFLGAATVGVEPGIMGKSFLHHFDCDLTVLRSTGVGPAYAIPKLLHSKGIEIEDVDFF